MSKAFAIVNIVGICVGILVGSISDALKLKGFNYDLHTKEVEPSVISTESHSRFENIIEQVGLYLILAITLVSFQYVLGQNIDYETQIQPIFDNSCMPCHAGGSPSSGLDLSSYENVMSGSNSGPVVIAGDYENSILWQEVQSSWDFLYHSWLIRRTFR